jgi:hypothetical protein
MQKLVADGHLTEGEAHILNAIKMQGIQLDGGTGKPIRQPQCQACGRRAAIIGTMAQTFQCPCTPYVDRSIADAIRDGRRSSES